MPMVSNNPFQFKKLKNPIFIENNKFQKSLYKHYKL